MLKKYFPLIALLAAALLFFWVKKNQLGTTVHVPADTEEHVSRNEPFTRDVNHISYSKHARCRMDCRKIDESEIKEIIENGEINYNKVEESPKGKTYPLEGVTHDHQHVRIVVAPHEANMVIVTVIDLDREWPCDCN